MIQADLGKRPPELSINMGGAVSIDITQQGVDQLYSLKKLRDSSGIDAVYDYPTEELGLKTVCMK